jgi:hypothetical protein
MYFCRKTADGTSECLIFLSSRRSGRMLMYPYHATVRHPGLIITEKGQNIKDITPYSLL